MKKVFITLIGIMLLMNFVSAQIVISTNTIWATNQTLTSSVIVNPGATLTILPGVVVDVLFLDNNSDGIGDIKLTVNGRLKVLGDPCNRVIFKPYVSTTNKRYWSGIDITSITPTDTNYINNADISYAFYGVKTTNSTVSLTGSRISNCESRAYVGIGGLNKSFFNGCSIWGSDSLGLMIDSSLNTTVSKTKIINCGQTGIHLTNSNCTLVEVISRASSGSGLHAYASSISINNSIIRANSKFGISANNSSINASNLMIDSSGYDGLYIGGSSNVSIQQSTITNNKGFGVEVSEFAMPKDAANPTYNAAPVFSINSSNIFSNGLVGVLINNDSIPGLVASTSCGNCAWGAYNNIFSQNCPGISLGLQGPSITHTQWTAVKNFEYALGILQKIKAASNLRCSGNCTSGASVSPIYGYSIQSSIQSPLVNFQTFSCSGCPNSCAQTNSNSQTLADLISIVVKKPNSASDNPYSITVFDILVNLGGYEMRSLINSIAITYNVQNNFWGSITPNTLIQSNGASFNYTGFSINQINTAFPNISSSNITDTLVNSSTVVTSAPSNAVACSGVGVLLTAPIGATNYTWYNNGSVEGGNQNSYTANANGNYLCVVQNNGCTSYSNTIAVTIIPAPNVTVTASGSTTICQGSSVQLSIPATSGQTYQWRLNGNNINGATSNAYVATQAGSYTVSATNSFGCSALSNPVSVAVNSLPPASITASGSTALCQVGASVTLNANTGGGLSYQWQLDGSNLGGATSASYVANISGIYTVVVTGSNNCTATSNSISVTSGSPPPATVTPTGTTLGCPGQVILNANTGSGLSYQWKLNGNDISLATSSSYTPTTAGDYSVAVTNTSGCSSISSITTVTLLAAPTASISPASISICNGQSATLTASGGGSYTWSNGGGSNAAATFSPTQTTTYTVTVTNANNCTATASRQVTVNSNPTASISPATVTICNGQSATLTASGGGTYAWSNGGGSNAAATFSPTQTTTYTVTATNANNCTATASRQVTVNSNPTASISPATVTICNGQSATLTASGGGTYTWSNSGGSGASATFSPTTTTTYTVTVTNANNCTATANSSVTVNDNPTATITGNNSICNGQSTTLTASGGSTYAWSNSGGSSASATFSPTTTTTYTVTVTNANNCTAAANSTVNVSTPTASITGTNSICNGQNTTLTASGGGTYAWSNSGGSIASATFSPTTTTTYTVTVTNANNCTATANSSVTVNANPTTSITGTNSICNGQNTTLTASGGGTYAWSNSGGSNAAATFSPTQTTTYTVTVTNANNCTATANSSVTVNANPTATITGTNSICNGQSTTLTASGGGTYAWSNSGGSGASATFSPTTTTTYTVTVTNANNCTAAANSTVNVSTPTASITGTNSICNGQNTTLTASGGGTYAWSNSGGSSASATFSPTTTTTYTVTVTNANNCTATANSSVTVNANPTATITGTNSICNGQSTTLTASGGGTYAWSNSGGSSASATFSPTTTTTYTVTVTNGSNCTATANSSVTVNANPTATITGTNSICNGQSTTLTASGGGTYAWSNSGGSGASATFNPTTTITYTVTVTNANNCTATANSSVTVNANPVAAISGASYVCIGSSATLNATGGIAYNWSNGSSTPTLTVSPTLLTTYTVTVTNNFGCTATASQTVDVYPLPNPNITGNNVICPGTNTVLTANGGVSYQWSSGTSGMVNVVSPNQTSSYVVTALDQNNCSASAAYTVTVKPVSYTSISDSVCFGDSIVFNGSTVITPGVYYDTLIAVNGCDSIVALTLVVNTLPQPIITQSGNALTTQVFSSYQWQLNNSNISNATGQTYNAGQNGNYTVLVTDVNGCSNVSNVYLLNGVGIAPVGGGDFSWVVYPNPTNDKLFIDYTGKQDLAGCQIMLVNNLGQQVLTRQVVNMPTAIDVSTCPKGVYILQMLNEQNVVLGVEEIVLQ